MDDTVVIGRVRIGEFVIEEPCGVDPDSVAIYTYPIEDASGEGADFSAAAFEAVIAEFYKKHF